MRSERYKWRVDGKLDGEEYQEAVESVHRVGKGSDSLNKSCEVSSRWKEIISAA